MTAAMIADAVIASDDSLAEPTPATETPAVHLTHFDPPHDTAGAAA
jgi:hypothetical protein